MSDLVIEVDFLKLGFEVALILLLSFFDLCEVSLKLFDKLFLESFELQLQLRLLIMLIPSLLVGLLVDVIGGHLEDFKLEIRCEQLSFTAQIHLNHQIFQSKLHRFSD